MFNRYKTNGGMDHEKKLQSGCGLRQLCRQDGSSGESHSGRPGCRFELQLKVTLEEGADPQEVMGRCQAAVAKLDDDFKIYC